MGRINLNGKQMCMKGKVTCLKIVACIDFSTTLTAWIPTLDLWSRFLIQISDPDLWSRSLIQISDPDLWSRSLIQISDPDFGTLCFKSCQNSAYNSSNIYSWQSCETFCICHQCSGSNKLKTTWVNSLRWQGLGILNKIRQVFKVTLVTNVLAFCRSINDDSWVERDFLSLTLAVIAIKLFFTDDVTKRYFYYWQIFTLVYNLLVRYSDMLHPNSHNIKLGLTKHSKDKY